MLFRAITTLIYPTSGDIIIDGKSLINDDYDLSQIGLLLEEPGFYPHLTGFENLSMLYEINNKKNDQYINKVLEDIGLGDNSRKKYKEYSLGMKQKLRIAQAIMEDQQLIILDEPFNGLDEASAKKIRAYLLKEKEKGKLIILSTHIKEDVKRLADTLYMFENGKVKNIKQKSK